MFFFSWNIVFQCSPGCPQHPIPPSVLEWQEKPTMPSSLVSFWSNVHIISFTYTICIWYTYSIPICIILVMCIHMTSDVTWFPHGKRQFPQFLFLWGLGFLLVYKALLGLPPGWPLFFLSALWMPFPCLLNSIVSDEKSVACLTGGPLWVTSLFCCCF